MFVAWTLLVPTVITGVIVVLFPCNLYLCLYQCVLLASISPHSLQVTLPSPRMRYSNSSVFRGGWLSSLRQPSSEGAVSPGVRKCTPWTSSRTGVGGGCNSSKGGEHARFITGTGRDS